MKNYEGHILQTQKSPTEKSRIPGIVCTKNGALIAYCEKRHGEGGDWAVIDIVMNTSFDGGKTWSDEKIIVKSGGHTINNPVMTVSNDNTIHFMWFRDYEKAFYQKSCDDGKTFTEPVEITYAFEKFRPFFDWKCIAAGPGHGICLKNGQLVVPVWLAASKEHFPSVSASIFSNDNGKTWDSGKILYADEELKNPNETAAVELSDSKVLFNYRNTALNHKRAVGVSANVASELKYLGFDEDLLDAWCFASLASCEYKGKHTIFFSNCRNGTSDRYHLTIRCSQDDCKTWSSGMEIADWAGYSDICVKDDYLYCYFELVKEDNMSLKVIKIPILEIVK
ncbi:MAG: glycoside hydrolase [Oscillospiraceae bacterium]|nr:glycoside hydrolase [Oscillospiraceae bacterium]